MNRILKITEDGSHTLFAPELNEHYHSYHGAHTESDCIFIKNGLLHVDNNKSVELNVLEVGFGTGLNAFLSLLKSNELNIKIKYTAIEPFPISKEQALQLNYPELLKVPDASAFFVNLHNHQSFTYKTITLNFRFRLFIDTIDNFSPEPYQYNLVYYDAFSPEVQPEMWSPEVFQKIYSAIDDKGILVTYCAKGIVKRTLRNTGFIVESLPGPPGKREIIRATKNM